MSTDNDVLDDDAAAPPGDTPPADDKAAAPPADDKPVDKPGEGDAKDKASGDVLSDDDDAADEGVPDQYTFDPPDGIAVDEEKLDAFKAEAKELGLTQKQFQSIVTKEAERQQAAAQAAVDGWNERVSGWREAARTDKEIGGENFDANVKVVKGFVDKFGDAEAKALLKSPSEDNPHGLAIGNHPALLRMLYRAGKALGDPDFVAGDDVTRGASDDAALKKMYPTMFKD